MSSSTPAAPGSLDTRRLILVPAAITLAVTLLRLYGEIQRWSPRYFNREPGGAGALVGIVWLVPVFAVYFALRLLRAGDRPSLLKTLGYALLGLAVAAAGIFAITRTRPGTLTAIALFGLVTLAALAVCYPGWPRLWRVLVAYALAARIPVAVVMLAALFAGWGTHYEKGPPGFPAMGTLATWFWIGAVPQLTLWIAYTALAGLLAGLLAALVHRLLG